MITAVAALPNMVIKGDRRCIPHTTCNDKTCSWYKKQNKSKVMLFMDASIWEQCELVWFLNEEAELNAGNYQRMCSVYSENCLVRTIGAKVFVKGSKRYQISKTIPTQMCLVKPRQSCKNLVEKCWNTHRTDRICLP
ncbi:hypothetical protein TNCV_2581431 [Trichonephila clavipes]|nr:hypothetical protein TNCV_2581431 [Trichonephila clavipes]